MEINKEEIKELAELYKTCLETARNTIGVNILGGTSNGQILTNEDYRMIASSIFIEYNKQHSKGRGGGNGQGKYAGPSTEKQQKAIAAQAMQGARKESIINTFLETNNKKSAEELSKSEASTLLDMLYGKK